MATKSPHVMIDIETLGRHADSCILSLGAILFDPFSGNELDIFETNVDLVSCQNEGMLIDADTVLWWLRRSKDAQEALLKNPRPVRDTLEEFSNWYTKIHASRVWAHGANFDPVLLEHAYRRLGMKPPFAYDTIRDTRTLFEIAGYHYEQKQKTAHIALADARDQVKAVQASYAKLGKLGCFPNGVGK